MPDGVDWQDIYERECQQASDWSQTAGGTWVGPISAAPKHGGKGKGPVVDAFRRYEPYPAVAVAKIRRLYTITKGNHTQTEATHLEDRCST